MKVLASVPTTDPRDHYLILDCLHWTIAAAGYSFGDGYPCPRCAEAPLAVSERSAAAIAKFSGYTPAFEELELAAIAYTNAFRRLTAFRAGTLGELIA